MSRKFYTIVFFVFLMPLSAYGQDYAAKVQDYFNKRSCLPGIAGSYVHNPDDDYLGWSGFQDSLPNIVGTLDSEGIERMCDWAGRVIAWRVEEFIFGNALYRASNYQPVILPPAAFESMLNTTHPGASKKTVVISRLLMDKLKARPNFISQEAMPLDHNYTGKSQYLGFLSTRIGVFTSLGLSWYGSEYNAIAMDIGKLQFKLRVNSAYFQAGTFLVLDYECWVRPVSSGFATYYHIQN